MKNWAGQGISAGTVVGRGARDGNLTAFKIGLVLETLDDGRAVVQWATERRRDSRGPVRFDGKPSIGRTDLHSLFQLDIETLDAELQEDLRCMATARAREAVTG
ncbi:hypothetical protein CH253_08200 [Rhodococcus sp. 06-156-3C]|nr:hypothetical protein CH253_08200 [Rhodococcus sp. 06-156-3C]